MILSLTFLLYVPPIPRFAWYRNQCGMVLILGQRSANSNRLRIQDDSIVTSHGLPSKLLIKSNGKQWPRSIGSGFFVKP